MTELPHTRHLLEAKDLADSRYAEPVTVSDMAAAAGLSAAYFSREFKRAFGESPHQYLITRRMERAATLLRSTDWPVARICFTVGLEGLGSFTTAFGRMYGMSPTAYREAHPPAAGWARVPPCIIRSHGRPQHRSFREDRRSATP